MKSKALIKGSFMPPELFQNAIPVSVPPMQYKSGIMKDIAHNMKMRRMSKDMERRKEIAESQNAIIKANLDTMHAVMTHSAKLQDTFEKYQFNRDLRTEILRKRQLENQLLFYQAKNEEMEFAKRKKEFDREYGSGED